MKSFSAFLLSLVFCLHIVGYLIVFSVARVQAFREMKTAVEKGVPDSRLTAITIPAEKSSELNWTEKKEFSYKGKMYDVVKTKTQENGAITYYCLNDSRETSLFNFLKKNIDGKKDKHPTGNSFQTLTKILPVFYPANFIKKTHFKSKKTGICLASADFYRAPFLKTLNPPPRF